MKKFLLSYIKYNVFDIFIVSLLTLLDIRQVTKFGFDIYTVIGIFVTIGYLIMSICFHKRFIKYK